MIVKKFQELIYHIQTLSQKEFKQYLIATLASIAIVALGALYYVHHTSSSLIQEIKHLNKQLHHIDELFIENEAVKQEETKINELLDKHPDFNINSYFEKFYTKHNLTPEPNWKPEEGTIVEGAKKGTSYQEIILRATFKEQTTQKLVTILQDIYKEPIIYLKALEITAQKSKINFELTLATRSRSYGGS